MTESSATFLLFGATGDLARRMIFPSLYNLLADGLLPDDFLIVASARSPMSDEDFRADVDAALRQFLASDRYDAETAGRGQMAKSDAGVQPKMALAVANINWRRFSAYVAMRAKGR